MLLSSQEPSKILISSSALTNPANFCSFSTQMHFFYGKISCKTFFKVETLIYCSQFATVKSYPGQAQEGYWLKENSASSTQGVKEQHKLIFHVFCKLNFSFATKTYCLESNIFMTAWQKEQTFFVYKQNLTKRTQNSKVCEWILKPFPTQSVSNVEWKFTNFDDDDEVLSWLSATPTGPFE